MSNVIVSPLYEGTFSVGTDKIFRRIDRQDPPYKGALKLSVNPFLIRNGEQNILFDAGIGDLFGEDTSIETILNNLEEHSLSDYEITDIFISHLHFDHMAGLANRQNGYWELTFPEATVWVSGDGWQKLHATIDKQDDDKKEFFHFLDSRAVIKFLAKEDQPLTHVRVARIGGHTEFHQALFFEKGKDRYVMAGDVIGTRGEVNRHFAAKYDFDPKQSMAVREELKEKAYREGYTFMTYHETDHPLFKLVDFDSTKGYKIENVSP